MAFIPCLNTAEVSLQFAQGDGEFAENVFGVERSIAWDAGSLLAMVEAFREWYVAGDGIASVYAGLQHTSVILTNVNGRDLTTSSGIIANAPGRVGDHGTNGDALIPQGQTFTLTARTALAGRSFRGRTYLVGLDESFYSGGSVDVADSAHANTAVLAWNALITAVTAADADAQLVVISRYHLVDVPPPTTLPRANGVMTPIVAYGYHDLFMDYQRRRAPGHNRHH
jgi:hypothetical protein